MFSSEIVSDILVSDVLYRCLFASNAKRLENFIACCLQISYNTQEQFAEKIGLTPNYISTVERGTAFPRYDKLVAIINGLGVSADALFCDVVEHGTEYKATWLSQILESLPNEEQRRILQIVELMVKQAGNTP